MGTQDTPHMTPSVSGPNGRQTTLWCKAVPNQELADAELYALTLLRYAFFFRTTGRDHTRVGASHTSYRSSMCCRCPKVGLATCLH